MSRSGWNWCWCWCWRHSHESSRKRYRMGRPPRVWGWVGDLAAPPRGRIGLHRRRERQSPGRHRDLIRTTGCWQVWRNMRLLARGRRMSGVSNLRQTRVTSGCSGQCGRMRIPRPKCGQTRQAEIRQAATLAKDQSASVKSHRNTTGRRETWTRPRPCRPVGRTEGGKGREARRRRRRWWYRAALQGGRRTRASARGVAIDGSACWSVVTVTRRAEDELELAESRLDEWQDVAGSRQAKGGADGPLFPWLDRTGFALRLC